MIQITRNLRKYADLAEKVHSLHDQLSIAFLGSEGLESACTISSEIGSLYDKTPEHYEPMISLLTKLNREILDFVDRDFRSSISHAYERRGIAA